MSKTIKRSTAVEGNRITVRTPAFISLVGKPANQRAFSILRSDNEGNSVNDAQNKTQRVRRVRRSDAAPNLYRVVFPADFTNEDVAQAVSNYGLSEYSLSRSDEGNWQAIKAEPAPEGAAFVPIKLDAEGTMAYVIRTDIAPAEAKTGDILAMQSIAFDATKYTEEEAAEWLTRNCVDFSEKPIENQDGQLVLRRMDVVEGEEVRQMELEDGVVATIVRADYSNIPDGFIAVVNEYAYGGWGWGQLDFNASLADVEVCDKIDTGVYRLGSVLRDILFYSRLPVDVRKELVTRAAGQFADYVNDLLDTLPRQLLMSVATTQRSEKESDMSAKPTDKPTAPQTASTLTREDVASIVAEVLAQRDAAAKQAEEELQRSESAKAQQEEADKAAADLRRSEIVDAVTAALAPVSERLEKLEGTTILRSEDTDLHVQRGDKTAKGKPDVNQLFRGAIPGLRKEAAE